MELGEGCEANIAAGGFFQLLLQLRTVILQDSVLLRHEFPIHPIWNHFIFSYEEYYDFAGRLEAAMAQSPDPTERRLELAMPDLTRRIENLHEDLRSSFTAELPLIAHKVS